MRSPGTFRWMSAFGRRSATTDGVSRPDRRRLMVKVRGPDAVTPTQLETRPSSSHVPSTTSPPGASRAAMLRQAPSTSASSYCRSTLNARITAGSRPSGVGTSKPPRPNATGRSAGKWPSPERMRASCSVRRAHPRGIDLEAEHLHVGPGPAEPGGELERGHAARTVAEVDDEGVDGVQQGRLLRDPAVDASQPVRVGRAARDRSDGHAPSLAVAASVTRGRDHGERMPRR